MRKYILQGIFTLFILLPLGSCKKYLDVVPDNVATIDNAFTMRSQAEKFLFTCFSYMPRDGSLNDDPAFTGGDEMWQIATRVNYFDMARGLQNKVSPLGDRWPVLYRGIRDCNIFLENIGKVPDLEDTERARWIAEVKFLKAYYHFYLLRMYGPIPLVKENLPIDADINAVKVVRAPVDECFAYIVQLLNEAKDGLPAVISNPGREMGRITQPIALSFKAQVLVTAASPLFNGNTDQSTLKNPDGTPLFNASYSKVKWDSAAVACRQAIELCHQVGIKLYTFTPDAAVPNLSPALKTQMNIRNSVAQKWNAEIIWANTQSNASSLQSLVSTWWDPALVDGTTVRGELSPPLKIAEMFYTKNGVPINEDKTWNYSDRYGLRTAGVDDRYLIRQNYTTANLHFDREPRFYANLGFDGGVYYGQGRYDDANPSNLFYLEAKFKQRNGFGKPDFLTVTGYYIKKLVHYQNVIGNGLDYTVNSYPWPILRLADLYLLYAEALNESEGPVADVYTYTNLVRARAGLNTVEASWTASSTNPNKYQSKDGMRAIIQQERLIELSFEAKRFWDLRRWKTAEDVVNIPIKGWDIAQEQASAYYRPTVIFNQTFGTKDYFWPINESYIVTNRSLVQNLGW
ncbi:MAG: RagB/SusD family nutrient uptake outer membrane protein [Sphingobacteriaceae bacterium]|nr:RagB/SusD family nutrient uptake outer membrane protein [Sphingobacteriaceae bacterium]